MSSSTTTWILNFVDKVTAPVKKMAKSISGMTDGIDNMTGRFQFSEKETRKALTDAKLHLKDQEKAVKGLEEELKQLQKAYEDAIPGHQKLAAQKAFIEKKNEVEAFRKKIQETKVNVEGLEKELSAIEQKKQNWANVATGINQAAESITRAVNALNFTVEIQKLSNEVQRMTDLSGDALDDFVKKSREIGAVYNQNSLDVARAANAMTKQVGGTFEENLALIEQGFKTGANSNGQFLDSLKEYPSFVKQLGLSGAEAIAYMSKTAKDGIYSDKAIDTLKEADLALREMTKTQEEALTGIGLSKEDLEGKTTFEAIQTISQSMKGATTQARQTIIADIFKGAGEDAGIKLIEELGSMDLDLSKLPVVEESATGFKIFFSKIQTWAGQAFGNMGTYAQTMLPMVDVLAGGATVMQLLSKVTWLNTFATTAWTVATKLLGKSILGIPIIGWIIAIVSAIVFVVSMTEGWGKAWDHTLKGMQLLLEAFVLGVKANFTAVVDGVMIAIDAIKLGWYKFKEAVGIGDSAENQAMITEIEGDIKERADAIKDGYAAVAEKTIEATNEFVNAAQSIKWKKSEEEEISVNDFFDPNAERLSFNENEEEDEKKGKGLSEAGASSLNGSGGSPISMELTVNNYFNVQDGADIMSKSEQIIDMVVGGINARVKDGLIAATA